MSGTSVTLFLSGDLMLGRGLDQILPHAVAPGLRESVVHDARDYVRLAYEANGSFPLPVDVSWPWGDALDVLDSAGTSARVVNLETAITSDGQFAPGKEIHYRMGPGNIGALSVARPSVCVLANNHMLDFGTTGLSDTLENLAEAGIPAVGAGPDQAHAWRPAIVAVGSGRRLVVGAAATDSSGVPAHWAATAERAGVARVPALTPAVATSVARPLRDLKHDGDLAVLSIHWGSNWGYHIEPDQVAFARRLIDEGVDVVHGHSSHHPRPIEVYRGKLIIYGCGDLINDYEGIGGYAEYRPHVRLMYLVSIDPDTGDLIRARLVPMAARQMSLHRATIDDGDFLRHALGVRSVGCQVRLEPGGDLIVEPDRTQVSRP